MSAALVVMHLMSYDFVRFCAIEYCVCNLHKHTISDLICIVGIIEGVRARVSQPSFYNSLPVCSIGTFRTYLKGNRQEL